MWTSGVLLPNISATIDGIDQPNQHPVWISFDGPFPSGKDIIINGSINIKIKTVIPDDYADILPINRSEGSYLPELSSDDLYTLIT